jgi:hypothetical protein
MICDGILCDLAVSKKGVRFAGAGEPAASCSTEDITEVGAMAMVQPEDAVEMLQITEDMPPEESGKHSAIDSVGLWYNLSVPQSFTCSFLAFSNPVLFSNKSVSQKMESQNRVRLQNQKRKQKQDIEAM